ncbi:cytochrome P450 2U1-like [Gigantopelta aegis]|uniref:cytochrome P450 2U1-like n=1 Tax=Gigantopelta aegis TaxID=1735272 RepID=UPI001B88995E|nr:cytochrome P450 2U1-like [Gigantopelta aegis]
MSAILVLAVLTLCLWRFSQRPRGVPPGPWPVLPIIGNFIQVSSDPVSSFRKMRKKYGDIFSVYFADRLVIVINGLDNLKEAFVKNGDVFSDRPILFILDLVTRRKGILGTSGHVWKEQRQLAMLTLKYLGMGKNVLEGRIKEEVTALVDEMRKANGEAVDFRHLINTSVSNVISAIVFGRRFDFEDPKFVKIVEILDNTAASPLVLGFFPFLHLLPGDLFGFKRLKRDIDIVLTDLVDVSIEDHMQHYDEDNVDDFISVYIKEVKLKERLGETDTSIDIANLRMVIWNLFLTGTESTATAILWLLLYFMHFPEVQNKCFAEIVETIGSDRSICLKDKTDLPYLEATLMEILRYADIVPFSAMRGVSKETVFGGYRFPKDVIVLPIIDSVLSDPQIWGDPENFRPDRFLDENGRLVKSEEHIPFFFGPRSCLGESLARMELFLFVAALIQKFEFVAVEGRALPTLKSELGFTQSPKQFEVRAVLRK